MDKMKKITIIATIFVLIFVLATTTFADQYGETYYQVLTTYPDEGPWSVPEAISPGENLYTFALSLAEYWNDPSLEGRITFVQSLDSSTTYTVHLDFNSDLTISVSGNFGSQTFTTSSTPNGMLVIPFNTMTPIAIDGTFNQFIEILNNEQLTGAANEYNPAYQAGYNDAVETVNAGRRLIITIFETPINILQSMLNFEILGVNILGFVTGIFSLAIIAFIVKKVT